MSQDINLDEYYTIGMQYKRNGKTYILINKVQSDCSCTAAGHLCNKVELEFEPQGWYCPFDGNTLAYEKVTMSNVRW